jgi:carboxylesterase
MPGAEMWTPGSRDTNRMIWPIGVVAAALAVGWRTWHIRRIERAVAERCAVGPDGIVIGAEPFDLEHEPSAPALLLLHGGGDTPQTLRYLGEYLHHRGYAISAPLLPGHGRSLRAFAESTADDWLDEALRAYAALKARHGWVGVIGLSMGGALAVQLAAEAQDIPALGLVAPYLAMPSSVARAAALARYWGPLVPLVRTANPFSIHDPAEVEKSRGYGAIPATALHALLQTSRRAFELLPGVTAPTIMIQSRVDNRISSAAAQRAFGRLGAWDKQLVWTEGAGHVLTVDYGRETVFERLFEWMESKRGARV